MEDLERKNLAVARADLSGIVDKVRLTREPVVIQKNNRDVAAIVPLELLTAKQKQKQSK